MKKMFFKVWKKTRHQKHLRSHVKDQVHTKRGEKNRKRDVRTKENRCARPALGLNHLKRLRELSLFCTGQSTPTANAPSVMKVTSVTRYSHMKKQHLSKHKHLTSKAVTTMNLSGVVSYFTLGHQSHFSSSYIANCPPPTFFIFVSVLQLHFRLPFRFFFIALRCAD